VNAASLRELARLYGIQLNYDDAAGKKRIASSESIEAVLRALVPEGMKLDKALARKRNEIESRVVEPVIVAWNGRLKLPKLDVEPQIVLENGERFRGPGRLPFGYHTLKLGRKEAAKIFAAPMRAPEPKERAWGVFTPLYALHSDRTWGVGDLSDMRALQDWIRGLGGTVAATLPMNAIFAEEDPSPYSPISRLYWNEMYLDVRRLPEYRGEPLEPVPITDRVDYRQVMAAKRRLLVDLSRRFFEDPEDGFAEFAAEANDYALFRSRMESTHALWRDWADEDEFSFDAARYHLYVQYRMQQQLSELEGMYLDFPLGVHPNGYDAWRFDEDFARHVSVGAPPDLFFTKGQNWGFPPLHPHATREHHHDYFRECVRRQLQHAAILRIDHVMGLHRLFWIAEGMEPADGVYVRYPADELYAVLTIEAHRANAVIVGEDLGTVPQYVPETMSKHGIHRLFVVQYELKPQGANPAGKPPADAIGSINTHDMPTFAGYWSGRDIEDRLEQGLLDESGAAEERTKRERTRRAVLKFLRARGLLPSKESDTQAVLESLLRFLGESDAEIVLVNLEDLWLEETPQNMPGVPGRSWRQRLRLSLKEMQADPGVVEALRVVDRARRKNDGDEN
jgi:4-alpha-glucanotransferase